MHATTPLLHNYMMTQIVIKDVETEMNKVEMSFSFDQHSCILKVGINQAMIQTPYAKRYPNSYVTGYVCKTTQITSPMCDLCIWNAERRSCVDDFHVVYISTMLYIYLHMSNRKA